MIYLLDSNIFIAAKNEYYAFDICPGFWQWLKTCEELHSTRSVYDEITHGTDDLSEWIKVFEKEKPAFFVQPSMEIQKEYANILWTLYQNNRYSTDAINGFSNVADSWIVATAKCCGGVIVTNEKADPNCRKRVKIPDAAACFGLQCISIFDVMRDCSVRLTLGQ